MSRKKFYLNAKPLHWKSKVEVEIKVACIGLREAKSTEQEIFESFGKAGFKLDRRRRQPNRKVSNDF